jgi:hypothetical protein
LDTARPLLETKSGNRYILVAIDHYSKWCEARAVADHSAKTASRFLEDDIICKYGVPRFILTDNGGEWAAEFEMMCKDYGIQHQHIAPQCKIRWKNRKTLLICGFLQELPLPFWITPHFPAYEMRPRSSMFHLDKTISSLEQILHTRDVKSGKMVR